MAYRTIAKDGSIMGLEKKYTITPSGCWFWKRGTTSKGYPCVWNGRIMDEAHRVIYEKYKGKISEGYDLHHTCEMKICVNPEHMELTLHTEHKSKHKKEFCKRGHKLTESNTYVSADGYSRCKACVEYRQ
jgi:hypothetical protein